MGRTAGRGAGDTQRLVLEAASEVFRTRGTGATLDDVAQQAGVSKGGLVYHFPSKDALVQALVGAMLEEFRAAVHACLDPDDDRPGRLVRAYVRASLSAPDTGEAREASALIAQLITAPAVADVARADVVRWKDDFAADGLPADVVTLVVSAADGASVAPLWGAGLDDDARERLVDRLLRLTVDSTSA
ncbi:TetR/AcrR family transcriptional regulator [Cellulomonas cellasea]|uniref:AcrR family transcriptional regulator n=1 Tax=Cellulomonas cellasea TaxID=43670 RepID=A0A7W4UBQ2_9CELL|nr:TetR/AcrR family transcriptional regulator [Cellulomonas cellasea]MBB2921270.1 AcrR family transcriptional regulator [Cellulomonas cellasea]